MTQLLEALIRMVERVALAASAILVTLYRPLGLSGLFVIPVERSLRALRQRVEEFERVADGLHERAGQARMAFREEPSEHDRRLAEHGLVPEVIARWGLVYGGRNLLAGVVLGSGALSICPPGGACDLADLAAMAPCLGWAWCHLTVAALQLGMRTGQGLQALVGTGR